MTPKEWRITEGLGIGAVATMLNLSVGYVSLLERGLRTPSFEVMLAYSKASDGKVTLAGFEKTLKQS